MTKVAISQPTYMPWIGYFNIIDLVDYFVLLDTVQFDKRSWQQRNKIKTTKGLEWISIPVEVKGKRNQKIFQTKIQKDSKFPFNHIKSLELNYKKSPFYEDYFQDITKIFIKSEKHQSLSILNIDLIKFFCKNLKIKTNLITSRDLNVSGEKSELLINICKSLKCYDYYSTMGSSDYLKKDKKYFDAFNIKINLIDYNHPLYRQRFGQFKPYACIIDLLFNEGSNSLNIIRKGRLTNKVL